MLAIVGHGPSILSGLGSVIDSCTVVRLKQGLIDKKQKPEHWGTRTDYLCARSGVYQKQGTSFWLFNDDAELRWLKYFEQFKPKYWKPSVGLCAVFKAIDNLNPQEIGLIGFDRVLYQDDDRSHKWNTPGKPPHPWPHCQRAEHECLYSLGVRIIDLTKEYEAQKEAKAG